MVTQLKDMEETVKEQAAQIQLLLTQLTLTLRKVGVIKEHKRNCILGQSHKSTEAEQALSDGNHKLKFQDKQLLTLTTGYQNRMIRKAKEIRKHENKFNRKKEVLKLDKMWTPVLKNTTIAKQIRTANEQDEISRTSVV
ncbi:uncharacterized protein LOC126266392 [Aethina tumida]|uniref:uncharacterized protein LOC126266392 n=1 Tax=Aethina tumida TaxID=116153 RepID=UPI002148F641|nr:uncharacterized protein LOC126266392 [Aethina tumida]